MSSGPVRWASVGLGGYAWAMCEQFLRASAGENPPIKLEAVCEPDQVLHAAKIAELRAKGIKVFANYDELLAEPVEVVWLPVPIDLHRPFTEKAAAAGKAVICEKPAAGCVDDLDAMIAARDKYGVKAAIAFQDIYDDATNAVKKELVGGAIGKLKSIALHACWPRGEKYYGRSTWAGKNKRNGVWVMDSPASNALAHYINGALFFLGQTDREMAKPISISAELYRVNPIETFDTCSLRVTVEGGATLLVLLTHACQKQVEPTMHILGERGQAHYKALNQTVIESTGQTKTISMKTDTRQQMIQKLARWVRGDGNDLVVSLEMARRHLEVVNGASEAVAVTQIEGAMVEVITKPDGEKLRMIKGIEAAFAECAVSGKMLHESGSLPWTSPAGTKDLNAYKHFNGPV